MKQLATAMLFGFAVLLLGCAAGPSVQERRLSAAKSIEALQRADFETAESEADAVLAMDPGNSFSALVRAVTVYKATLHNLFLDMQSTVAAAIFGRGLNTRYLLFSLETADKAFAEIEGDLAVAAAEPAVDLTLCLACLEYDWNRNGEIDAQDRYLLEIEVDAHGEKIPKDDPRRRPTYRFDYGDVLWARAFIAFHRAAVSLVMAFDAAAIFENFVQAQRETLTITLASKEKLTAAKQHILTGLDFSDKSREAYLAETDDDREWLPNPRQKNHPMPLSVDDALYDTWRLVVSDVRKLITGEEGLSLAELAQLGDIQWDRPPDGYLDIGRIFREPETRVIRIDDLEEIDDHNDPNAALGRVLGKYRVANMKHSMLIRRLSRMKAEVETGQESIERKLRYLLWVN